MNIEKLKITTPESDLIDLKRRLSRTRWPKDPSDSFDVVVPSLPGYGYSDAPCESGMSIWRVADLIHQLMQNVLGYSKFVASGGDWGAYATSYLGYNYAEQIPAIHLSYVPGGINPEITSKDVPLSRAETDLLAHRQKWTQHEGGYQQEARCGALIVDRTLAKKRREFK
jgi:pimeloyl-ACP methyl ester carboxylesterase